MSNHEASERQTQSWNDFQRRKQREREDNEDVAGDDEIEEYVTLTIQAWNSSAAGILEAGRMLNRAKERCSHGDFAEKMIARMPFCHRTANKLMALARNKVLSNSTNSSNLPPAWNTIYDLSRIHEKYLELEFKHGRIHCGMTAADVKRLGCYRFDEAIKMFERLRELIPMYSIEEIYFYLQDECPQDIEELGYFILRIAWEIEERGIEMEGLWAEDEDVTERKRLGKKSAKEFIRRKRLR